MTEPADMFAPSPFDKPGRLAISRIAASAAPTWGDDVRIAVIDDDPDIAPIEGHHVHVDADRGLRYRDVFKVWDLLGEIVCASAGAGGRAHPAANTIPSALTPIAQLQASKTRRIRAELGQ